MEFHFGAVIHEVKVTYLGSGRYGCRVYTNGAISQQALVHGRVNVGPKCREMLRMEHKCGNHSDHADNARHRATRKELALRAWM